MPTVAPPDDVQKERFARVDERFDEVNRRITEGRETHRCFNEFSAEMRAFGQEMTSLHATVQRGNYTLLAAMLGLIGTILIKGG